MTNRSSTGSGHRNGWPDRETVDRGALIEQCAKVAEKRANRSQTARGGMGQIFAETQDEEATQIAKAIRALAEQPHSDGGGIAQGSVELRDLILEYARDLRRNSSGGDDYPFELMRPVADYLENLVDRTAAEQPTPAQIDAALNAWFKSPPSETDQGLERSMKAALIAASSLPSTNTIADSSGLNPGAIGASKGPMQLPEFAPGASVPSHQPPAAQTGIRAIKVSDVKRFIESALQWQPVFEDGRGGNDLKFAETCDLLCERLIRALTAGADGGKDQAETSRPAAERGTP